MDKRHYNHKQLQKLRIDAGLTQEDLAKKLGIHEKSVSRVENGRSASFPLLAKITSLFGQEVKSIIYDTPPSK